jgi:DNA primase
MQQLNSKPQATVVLSAAATNSPQPVGPDTGSSSLFDRGERRRPIDYSELKRRITIRQVLNLLGWHAVTHHEPQLRGPCPVHGSTDERSRSFAVNTQKNVFHCFKSACGVKGNQLDLYMLATGLPALEAAHQLCEKLGVPAPVLEPVRRPQNERESLAPAD